ncbi:MAG TPA: hypothetical protein VHU40_10395, partial [Polyangia bacterium]|nr:hypothetical protein [Polyangia bacterium]
DQLNTGATLLGKFEDTQSQTYKLAVTAVSASSATTIAANQHVVTMDLSDTGANVASSMDDLQTIDAAGKLNSITLGSTAATKAMSMDVSRLKGTQLNPTQAILDKIKKGGYQLSITGASAADLTDLAANRRVSAITVADSSTNIKGALSDLAHLGGRLTAIEQTDSGTALDLTQSQFDARAAVLSKINGGYTANLTEVTAAKAVADARNVHVKNVSVIDSGRNILSHWSELLAMGNSLGAIDTSDHSSPLTLTAGTYSQGKHDGLVAKFDQDVTFAVTGAGVATATAIAGDQAVTRIDIADTSNTISGRLSDLQDLLAGGKVSTIINQTPAQSLAFDYADLADAQDVLDAIKGGSYTLALSGVDAADAKDLLANNHKITSVSVTGDAADIVDNLSDLAGIGNKLSKITRTDTLADELEMTGTAFEKNAGTLAKIEGGYVASLTNVSASKAASFGANNAVSSMIVTDSAAHLSSAWKSLDSVGDKLTTVTQTDSSALQLTVGDWLDGQGLRAKFDSDPTVSVSGVAVANIDDLLTDDAVTAFQIADTSGAVSDALASLAGQTKLTQIVLNDPSVALDMTAATYQSSTALLNLVKNQTFNVELSNVSASAGATLASDAHVTSMDVVDSAANISTNFDALVSTGNLNSLTLSNEGGTLTLSADQILNNQDALGVITNAYELTATGVTMDNLADITDLPQVSGIRISDTADAVSEGFGDLLALGNQLGQIHLTDGAPVLTLSQASWTAGAGALAKIDASYHADITDAFAGDAQSLAGNATVSHVAVSDNAGNIAGNWDTLVALYDGGAGKLNGITLGNTDPLSLTADQQTNGAALIADLLADATIETV